MVLVLAVHRKTHNPHNLNLSTYKYIFIYSYIYIYTHKYILISYYYSNDMDFVCLSYNNTTIIQELYTIYISNPQFFCNYMNLLKLSLTNKSLLINKSLFKFWIVLHCAVYRKAALKLTISCNSIVSLYTVFMDSMLTVQLMHNLIPDPS